MGVSFSQLFTSLPDGSISPLRQARIRGVDLKPGLWIGDGVTIPGLELITLRGRDLEVEDEQGISVVRAAY